MVRFIIPKILCFLFVGQCFAQTKVPLFFSDSMVLQRQTQVSIWGKDNANKSITVTGSWGNSSTTTTGANGKWKLKLQTPTAGGPYTVTIAGSNTITLKGVLIGEVWFCSGQSNMEMPMKGYLTTTPLQLVDSADFFIANSANTNIRLFKPGWNPVSRTPLDELTGPGVWESASPTNTPDFSATAYFFARRLQLALNVPLGVIVSARGGSSIESWLDSTTLASIEPVILPAVLDWQTAHNTPTMMFNTFLNPYIGYTIKGIIWSQGEANRANHQQYLEMFTKLINSWRDKWGQGTFPFYFAEIPPGGTNTDTNGVSFREAQLNTMLTVDSTGMASTMDIGNAGTHYPKKKVVGDRLAQWALTKNYGFSGVSSGPIFKSFTTILDTIKLRFDYSGSRLAINGNPLADFEIAGSNGIFYAATATFANFNFAINVRSNSVPQPRFVRYAFKNLVTGTLFNLEGFPAPSFRTQNIIAILPVTFGDISVKNINGLRLLKWNSLQEINVNSYEVERSLNATGFTSIAKIIARGSNTTYQFEDNNALNSSTIFYRIKVNNTDGSIEYSSVVKVIVPLIENKITIINPAKSTVQLRFANAFTGSIIITDNLGRIVAAKNFIHQIGNIEMSLPKTFKGMAIAKIISSEKQEFVKKFIVL